MYYVIIFIYDFRKEVMTVLQNSQYNGIWSLHAAAAAPLVTVRSIYPEYAGATVRQYLDRLTLPRQADNGTFTLT